MATYTLLSLDEARALGHLFGLTIIEAQGLSAGSVNSNYALSLEGGGSVFLRIYEEQSREGAEGELALLQWLSERGLPTARALPRLDGAGRTAELHGKAVAVFPWVSGVIRCQATVSPDDARTIGSALARIHLAGSPSPRPGRFRLSDLRERCARIGREASPELAALAPKLLGELDAIEASRSAEAPRGLCHGDLFRDNVLWSDGTLAALLDFESASEEPFAFDLAVTLLAWCYGDDFDPALTRAMVESYQAARPLTAQDRAALFVESRLAALRFTITRITDYAMRAHLGANTPRDYRRFLARHDRITALGERGWAELLGLGASAGR